MEWNNGRDNGGYYWQMLESVSEHYHIDMDAAGQHISRQEKLEIDPVWNRRQDVRVHMPGHERAQIHFSAPLSKGVIPNLERRYRETNSDYIRNKISEFMSDRPCPTCEGDPPAPGSAGGDRRLAKYRRGDHLAGTDRPWTGLSVWRSAESPFNRRERTIAERILKEIESRLGFPGRRRAGLPDPAALRRLAVRR